jgi:regulator of replication initiation timing
MADLKEILGEELYNQIKEKAGDNKIGVVSDGSYVPADKFNALNDQKKSLGDQIKILNESIGGLKTTADEYEKLKPQFEAMKTAAGENPLLKQQIEDLQTKLGEYPGKIEELQNQNSKWESKYKDTVLDSAIRLAAIKAGAIDPDDILKYVDKSKLDFNEDGSVKGLDEQMGGLSENKKYLFGETTPAGSGANPPGGGGNVKTDAQKLSDQYDDAVKSGNTTLAIAIKNKFIQLTKK